MRSSWFGNFILDFGIPLSLSIVLASWINDYLPNYAIFEDFKGQMGIVPGGLVLAPITAFGIYGGVLMIGYAWYKAFKKPLDDAKEETIKKLAQTMMDNGYSKEEIAKIIRATREGDREFTLPI